MTGTITVLSSGHRRIVELLAERGIEAFGTDDARAVGNGEILVADPSLAVDAIGRMNGLRWIQSTWAGVDRIVSAGIPDGVTVTRLVGVFGTQMREFVFGHLLAHRLGIVERLRRPTWDERPPDVLAGRRMGILGTGTIGRALARTATHFDLHTVGCNRTGSDASGFDQVFPVERVREFADGLEILVVTVPATPATVGLVDSTVLGCLARGAVLVNVGRGSVVDVPAVVDALRSGRLARAVLDVLPDEPLPDGHPWWSVPGMVITSHTAAWSRPEDIVAVFAENLDRWRGKRPLIGTVDSDLGY